MLVSRVAHETEVAEVATLAEGLRADEVGVGQVAVVDDVAVAEHRAETLQYAIVAEDVLVETLGAFEVELV